MLTYVRWTLDGSGHEGGLLACYGSDVSQGVMLSMFSVQADMPYCKEVKAWLASPLASHCVLSAACFVFSFVVRMSGGRKSLLGVSLYHSPHNFGDKFSDQGAHRCS